MKGGYISRLSNSRSGKSIKRVKSLHSFLNQKTNQKGPFILWNLNAKEHWINHYNFCLQIDSYLTIIHRRRGDYSTIIAEPEENNCYGIIVQVIIRANAFSFLFSPETSKIARWPFWKLVLQYYNCTSRGVIKARYDVILDQSARTLLCNHLSNYTKNNTKYTVAVKIGSFHLPLIWCLLFLDFWPGGNFPEFFFSPALFEVSSTRIFQSLWIKPQMTSHKSFPSDPVTLWIRISYIQVLSASTTTSFWPE